MFKKIISLTLSYTLLYSSVFGAMITPDGKTNTTVNVNGNVSDVHTSTVSGNTGFNSFNNFDVYSGHTANLYLPDGTKNLINLVHDKASNIDGVLNAYKDGRIGGNVFFLNPNGIAVGAGGIINVGALTLATPTKEFMDNVISADRRVSSQLTKAILAGDMPINPLGLISVKGKINAAYGAGLHGGDIINSGDIRTNFEIGDIVNIDDKNLQSEVLVKDGRVIITAKNNFINEGSIIADGGPNKNAADISVNAGGDIGLKSGVISASGEGENSNGGNIHLWAEGQSVFNNGAQLLAKGGQSGDGGFIELSAKKLVDLAGGVFDASSSLGKMGTVFVDPEDIIISEDFASSGANYVMEAANSITLKNGKKVVTSKSGANSGNVSLTAKDITLEDNSVIDASAEAGKTAGNITLTAKDMSDGYMAKTNAASITLGENVSLKGNDISLISKADNTRLFDDDSTAASVGEFTIGELGDTTLFGGAIITDVNSSITIGKNSKLDAKGNIDINSTAAADGSMRALGTGAAAVYGESDVNSKVDVKEGATISAGGNVSISSKADSSLDVSAMSVSTANTPVPADGALAIGKMTVDNNVNLAAGSSVSGKDITIDATTDKNMSVSSFSGAFDDGYAAASVTYSKSNVNNGVDTAANLNSTGTTNINSAINSIKNKSSASAGTGTSAIVGVFLKGMHFAHDKIGSWIKGKNVQTNNQSNVKVGLSAALSYSDQNNTSTAKAGGSIKSDGGINVKSSIIDGEVRQAANASVDSKAGKHEKENAAAGSVGIASFNNNSAAYIAEGAVVDAKGAINVDSSVSLPFEITWHKIEGVGDVIDKINGNGGLQNGFFTTWAKSDVSTNEGEELGKFGLAGAVNIADFNSTSNAYIASGAKINEAAAYKSGAQDVKVTSGVDVSTLNMAGIWGITGAGTKSKVGLGGSYQQIAYNSNSSAQILGDAKVNANNLEVSSDIDQRNISIAEAGGKSETFGFEGAFDWLKSDTNSTASVSKDAQVAIEGEGTQSDKVIISAKDNIDMFNIAGGVTKTQNVGIGASVSISDITRNTNAFIGDAFDAANPVVRTTDGFFKSDKTIDISAQNTGDIYAYSLAGVIQNDKKEGEADSDIGYDPEEGASQAKGGGGKFGVGISGDVSYNNIEGASKAYINGADVYAAKDLSISAKDDSWINSVAGAVSLVLGKGTSVGFAGSASTNFVRNNAAAFINDSSVSMLNTTAVAKDIANNFISTGGGKLELSSLSAAEIIAVAASGSLANPSSKGGALAGSVTVNDVENTSSSYIKGSTVDSSASNLAEALGLSAVDNSKIVAVAGALGAAGTVGIGSSTGVNEISNITEAYLDGSSVTTVNDIKLDAQNNSTITNVEGTVGAAKDGMAIAASVAVNEIGNTTSSYIKDGRTQSTGGSLSVAAKDSSNMTAVAGEISGAGKAAVGSSTAVSTIGNKVYAYADGAEILAEQNADFKSDSAYILKTAAAGGAGSQYASITGSVAVNNIDTLSKAYAKAADIKAQGSAGFSAKSKNEINFYGGTIDGAAGLGLGGTVVVNNISDKAYAQVSDGSTLNIYGKHALTGEEKGLFILSEVDDDINTWMFNLAGGGVGVAASVDVTNIDNISVAEVSGSSVNQTPAALGTDLSGQNIKVNADNTADVEVYGGSIAGGGTAGIGAVADTVMFDNITKAGISGSEVSAAGDIGVNTQSIERYNSILMSGGGAATAGIAGNAVTALFNNNNNAYIKNSTVNNSGNTTVMAKDTVELGRKNGQDFAVAVGALAGGATAGIGGSVLVSSIKNKTKAAITDSTINTGKSLKVSAQAAQDIVSYIPTASLSGQAGIAASVGVNTIDSETEAYIDETASGSTVINGDAAKASNAQDVEVSAQSSSRIQNTIATVGAGVTGVGVGAGIGVSTINGKVSSGIGAGAQVNAKRNIKVESKNTRKVNDTAISGAAGFYGAANGSVLVTNIGSNLDGDSKSVTDGMQGTLNEHLKSNGKITKETFGRGGLLDDTAQSMQTFIADVNDVFTDKVLDDKGTNAFIGANARVSAGNKLEVLANDIVKTDLLAGGAGLGGYLSVGASVAIVNNTTSTKAFIGDNAELSSLSELTLKANSEVQNSDIKAFIGQGSLYAALGAVVAKVNSNNNTLAYLSDYVKITGSGAINISAQSKANIHAQTVGVAAAGLVAAGASIADVNKEGNTSAYTGEEATVENSASLNLKASSDSDITAEAEAGSGGIVSGIGAEADASVKDKVSAKIGKKNIIKTSGNVSVLTEGQAASTAKTYGVDVGGLAVGVSLADSEIKLDNKAEIARESVIDAGSVTVAAEQKKAKTLVDAFAASGALIGGAGATATSKVSGDVLANIHSKNNITAQNGITFKSKSNTDQTTKSTFYGGAVISAGVNKSDVLSDVDVKTLLNDGIDAKGSKIEISAEGSDTLYAKAVSGSGGALSASAAMADTANTSSSKVEIGAKEAQDASETLNNNITAKEVYFTASNTTNQDSEVDSRNGGIIHAGGAAANNTSEQSVAIDLKDRALGSTNITASHFKAEALNNYNKNLVDGANVYSGSGGALDVPITQSITTINNYTDITFGNGNNVATVSDDANTSSFLVNALNNIKADDKVLLKSGGLVVVPIVTSQIANNNNKARITVNNANLTSADDMVLNTKADVDIAAGADLNIYGGISVAAGKSLAKTVIGNEINLNSGAKLKSDGDVYFTFSQPKTQSNSPFDNTGRAYIRASGITNIWNTTALAFNADSQAKGDIFVNNNLNINGGSVVESSRDISVNGVKALMSATGLLDMTSPLGSLAASDKATSVETQDTTNVKVDGGLFAGVNNKIKLTIGADRTVTIDGGIMPGYKISKELLSNNIIDEIERLRVLKAQYSVSEVSAAAYQAEINRLESELVALGQVDSDGLIMGEVPVDIMEFDNIRANMGDIKINADNITGVGTLCAPGSAEVSIRNYSDLFLRFKDISIDKTSTGSIYYNGALVKTAQDIANANITHKEPSLSEVKSSNGLEGKTPSIDIVSDYSYQNRSPNIEFLGDVLNDNGDINIYSSGSIQAKGNMRARNINMEAKKKIVQSYVSNSFLHVAGNPYGYWEDIASSSEAGQTNTTAGGEGRGGGTSILGNNVFLSATYLDINGLIQSGTKDLYVDIGDSFTLSGNGLTFGSIADAVSDYWVRKNRHEANVNELYAINSSGNIAAYFNVLENRIEIKDVKVDGGKLELFGHILNTGGNAGELKVLDGYGRINVNNNSAYELFVNSLDAGSKIEGTIKITDTAKKDATGGFLETIYKRIGNDLVTMDSNTRDANGKASNIVSIVSNSRETAYNPLSGQRYYWNTGKEKIKETTYKKEQKEFWGMDFLVPDDSYTLADTRYLQDHSLYEGEFVKTGQDTSNAYTYTFENKEIILYDKDGNPVTDEQGNPVPFKTYDKRWSTTTGWWIFSTKTNHHEVKYEEGRKEINTHSIKADYPVKISFDGYDTSALDINSSKSNIILNGLINNSVGDVNITASNGAIKSNSADAYIKGKNINLNAKDGIGGANAVNIELTGGAVNALSAAGDINLASVMGSDLAFKNISTGAGNVLLKSERSLRGADSSSLIKADGVTLDAVMGSIGTQDAALNTDTKRLSASAQDDINIKNISSSDLGVGSIESKGGDVILEAKGGVYDDNKNEVIDQRSKEELLNGWNALDLMDEDGAGWTEDQLTYRIDAASLDNKVNTQYMVEDPNIKGKNVTVKAGGSIGQDSGSETFNIGDFKNLSDDKKLLIASAERDNIVFSEDGQTLTVLKREDFDIHADKVNLNANGFIYLGAEQDINVGGINAGAGHNITIMGAGGVYNVLEDDGVNITGNNLTLEAADGDIGSAQKALNIALTGKINARSAGDIYLKTPSSLAIDYIFAQGRADIAAQGALSDARGDELVNIRAHGINLNAGSIGGAGNMLGIVVEQGEQGLNTLLANTVGDANILNAEAKALYITGITSGGNIKLASNGGGILNAGDAALIDAAGDINLACNNCNIGLEQDKLNLNAGGDIFAQAAGIYGNILNAHNINLEAENDINISASESELISATAGGDILVASSGSQSNIGDITAGRDIDIYSSAADLVLKGAVKAENGAAVLGGAASIYSAGGAFVRARDINLTALNGAIGAADNPLRVEGSATGPSSLNAKADGGIYLTGFDNDLKVNQLASVNSDISIITDKDIKVNDMGGLANITANNITLHSTDGSVGALDNMVTVDVNNEGGLVNVIGADGIYLRQLRHTFNSDYIRNTRSGDVNLQVPFNDVKIKDVQKQGAFNIMLTGNTHVNNITLFEKNVKKVISDGVYNRRPAGDLSAKLKIFDNELPHVGYEDEPAKMME